MLFKKIETAISGSNQRERRHEDGPRRIGYIWRADGYRSGNFSSSIFESQKGELCVTTGDRSGVYLNAFDGSRFAAIRMNAPLGSDH